MQTGGSFAGNQVQVAEIDMLQVFELALVEVDEQSIIGCLSWRRGGVKVDMVLRDGQYSSSRDIHAFLQAISVPGVLADSAAVSLNCSCTALAALGE